jgi:hypothetical protein
MSNLRLNAEGLFQATKEGVESAFWAWMTSFDVTNADTIRIGVRHAMETWLENNGEAIFASIVRTEVRDWLNDLPLEDIAAVAKDNQETS